MPPIVDIHTHVYPPYYISLLRSRSTIPFIRSSPVGDRLIILPDEASSTSLSAGRPIGPEYYDISEKIAFMDKHSIGVSVISLANPWLDWVPSEEAAERARAVNDELNEMCGTYRGRLYAFGTLPVSGSVKDVVEELRRLKGLEYIRGVILGTGGKGKGLDDAEMGEVWKVIEETGTVVFVHPHYGLPGEVYGPRAGEYGHVLPLALGFPLETTLSISRLFLARTFDNYPNLQLLLAHSGGALPFLAGRIHSCILHDAHLVKNDTRPQRSIHEVLRKNLVLDAVIYGEVGLRAALLSAGKGRVLFGTDHPFFPPLEGEDDEGDIGGEWPSVTMNYKAIGESVKGGDDGGKEGILGGNAVELLRLDISMESG